LGTAPAAPSAANDPRIERNLEPPRIEADASTLSEDLFPCTGCHGDMEKNGTRRVLSFHDEQQSVFSHDARNRWCLDCHDLENRDVLRLINGAHEPFSRSHRLCGQCHADKVRDWYVGVHGKRVGSWSGAKTYLLCVQCHNPHSPRFQGVRTVVLHGRPVVVPTLDPVRPEPRPLRPEEMRR
jgi:hypothetical protein